MQLVKTRKKAIVKEWLIYLIVVVVGFIYAMYICKSDNNQQKNYVLQLAKSVEAILPYDELDQILPSDANLKSCEFPKLKKNLQKVVEVNPNTRFAYLYVKRNSKLYFIVDSEPANSPDYSPAGQEFSEADEADKLPFSTGKAQVTAPVSDRWGTWVSAEIPVFEPRTGKVIAVFGMDYNARVWRNRMLLDCIRSILLVGVIFILFILIMRRIKKNSQLRNEIQQRKEIEVNLRESEFTLSNLVSSLPGLIYRCALDENYTMEYISEACLRITGYSSTDFIGNKAISFNELILPEYRQPIWAKWHDVMASRTIFEEEYPIQTATGVIRWVWERGRCVFDENEKLLYLEGYVEDISDRKLAEKELLKISQAVEQNPVSVVITNVKGNIEYTNPKFTEMTGYSASEVLGKNPRILKSGKMAPEFYRDLWQTIASGNVWKGEFINRNRSGELYWAYISISPLFDELGKITHYLAVGEDITEKKKIETELIMAKDKAEESDRLKSAFLANISHEIRTPMNGILGFAELLKEPDLSHEIQNEYLGVIEKSGQRMLSIINDLIDISKIEAGQMTLRIRNSNVNKMLHDLHLFFIPEIKSRDLCLDFHCGLSDEESLVETDITKLNQILTNLIKNAIKFTENGSVKFGYLKKGERLEFYVSDTGPGIPDDQRELIFERFRQSNINNLSRRYEGAGLGLAITKAYIRMLGGDIWIESKPGEGSTFYFDIPSGARLN